MIENTRVYEIFRRVLEEYAYGERLGVPSDEGQRWLRATEALFYRDNPPFQIYSLASWIRPDIRAVRRNAYQRLFGFDLNHGTDDNRPYPYPRAAAANTDFASTFEELLREVWRAIENVRNQVGANQTDIATIANLARQIFDMLRVRRQEHVGNLARDELFHVSTMSWLHLTLSFNTPIVRDLKADATSPAERLQKIGERVGLRGAQPLGQLHPALDGDVADPARDGAGHVQRCRDRRAGAVPAEHAGDAEPVPGGDAADHHALDDRDGPRPEDGPRLGRADGSDADASDAAADRRRRTASQNGTAPADRTMFPS